MMMKSNTSCPVFQRDGVKNGLLTSYQQDTKISLTAMDINRGFDIGF